MSNTEVNPIDFYHNSDKKVYSVEHVVMHEGSFVESPIFTTFENAIKYMEDIVIKLMIPHHKLERDDSSLEKDEKAAWYELIEEDKLVYLPGYREDASFEENKKYLTIKKTGNFQRTGDYWRILERNLI